jgi:ASC-1-like (ASCH) protein
VDDQQHDAFVRLARMEEQLKNMHARVVSIKDELDLYVTLNLYTPVEKAVYGLIAIVAMAVIGLIFGKGMTS